MSFSNSLFDVIDLREKRILLSGGATKVLYEGDTVFSLGEKVESLFVLIKGRVKLTNLDCGTQERIIDVSTVPDVLSLATLFTEEQRFSAHCVAMCKGEVMLISKQVIFDMIEEIPGFTTKLLVYMSKKTDRLTKKIAILNRQTVEQKVVHYLLSMELIFTGVVPHVVLSNSKKVVAAELCIRHETISRVLHKLKSQNVIDIVGNRVYLKEREKLLESIAC